MNDVTPSRGGARSSASSGEIRALQRERESAMPLAIVHLRRSAGRTAGAEPYSLRK